MAKQMHRMEIIPAEGGHEAFKGATVMHHMREMARNNKAHSGVSMGYSEPESHVFGESEGHKMLAHIAEHLHISTKAPESQGEPAQETEEPEGEEEA